MKAVSMKAVRAILDARAKGIDAELCNLRKRIENGEAELKANAGVPEHGGCYTAEQRKYVLFVLEACPYREVAALIAELQAEPSATPGPAIGKDPAA